MPLEPPGRAIAVATAAAISAAARTRAHVLPHVSPLWSRQLLYETSIGRGGRGLEGNRVGSFKVKLVATFLLLSLLPLAAAFWGFSTVAARSETRRVDARCRPGCARRWRRYQDELRRRRPRSRARSSRNPAFQRALIERDTAEAAAPRCSAIRGSPSSPATSGSAPHFPLAATREVAVVGPAGSRGMVIASVPLNAGARPPPRAALRPRATAATSSCSTTAASSPGRPASAAV